ncbi:pilus assembly FimT family protein [Scytonema millei]|uniref:Type II secretion system protein n=1 Tax=Scytonema millei VB511283 TaxID=1245923 RepID=A0A9X5I459_9CYAN|nr:type II secretion system protein [Scytonema millei]NHC34244.1 type II secretion system protein [Scytonema millei VB511283]
MIGVALVKRARLQKISNCTALLAKQYSSQVARKNYLSNSGFTLLETLVTVIIVGVLAAIAAPSWVSFTDTRRLNAAQDRVLYTIQEAQSNAKRDKITWEACFRNDGNKVVYAVHPRVISNSSWNCTQATNWQSILQEGSQFITINSTNSTLRQNPTGYYRVRFRFDGALDTQDGGAGNQQGRITLAARYGGNNPKRCVIVSTLLGALRSAQDNQCQ